MLGSTSVDGAKLAKELREEAVVVKLRVHPLPPAYMHVWHVPHAGLLTQQAAMHAGSSSAAQDNLSTES